MRLDALKKAGKRKKKRITKSTSKRNKIAATTAIFEEHPEGLTLEEFATIVVGAEPEEFDLTWMSQLLKEMVHKRLLNEGEKFCSRVTQQTLFF